MRELAEQRDGWVNVQAHVPDDESGAAPGTDPWGEGPVASGAPTGAPAPGSADHGGSTPGQVNDSAAAAAADDVGGLPGTAPVNAGLFGWLSGRGPAVPVATWVPGSVTRRGTEPDSIGIQHGAGPRAFARLAEAGVAVPAGWRRLGDHPRRGLVVELPDGTDPQVALDWCLAACAVLSPAPLPDEWVAVVHRR